MGPHAREHHPHVAHPGEEEAAPIGSEGHEDDDDADDGEVDDVVPEGEDGARGHQVPERNDGWTWVDGKDGRGGWGVGTGWNAWKDSGGYKEGGERKEGRGADKKGRMRGKGEIDLTC